ncbi:hypothetical protein GCM10009039_25100 [Halocalculus aciditolerans]|uniref:Uncharacterized protein n=1 Tax=Halocalculus aciditolerans TaxID=1383812 RepID=A0A830FE16_9EURY|nr:hypothetical protein GCM10009039_25100 [Halocalculus aciditolerans]
MSRRWRGVGEASGGFDSVDGGGRTLDADRVRVNRCCFAVRGSDSDEGAGDSCGGELAGVTANDAGPAQEP